jgi:DNA-binding beta-propeller fold protein YncE
LANNYKNAKIDLSSTNDTTVYTCPSATQTIVKSILISNDSGSADTLNITLTNTSSAVFSIFKAKSVASNTTVELLSQPLIIMESEILKAQATTADRLHIIVSFLEVN